MTHYKVYIHNFTFLFLAFIGTVIPTVDSALATIKQYPQRIVSLGPINTENVFLLGAGDRLVGNTNYCVRPTEARDRAKIGSVMQISLERILSLKPDLVLATGLTRPDQVQQLTNLGLTVVRFDQPDSLKRSCEHFLQLGTLLGLEDVAHSIIAGVQQEINNIARRVKTLPRRKVFLQIGTQPLYGAANNSFTRDYIELAGSINVLGDQEMGKTNREKILATNPDAIIIAIMGSESGIAAEEKKKWMNFPVINAVKHNRVRIINPDLACSPSPVSFVQALSKIVNYIHPELIEEE